MFEGKESDWSMAKIERGRVIRMSWTRRVEHTYEIRNMDTHFDIA